MTGDSGRLRVLHVIDGLGLGGMERMAVELANLMDPSEFEVAMCVTRQEGPMADELDASVPLRVLYRRARWDPAGMARFARLVRARRIDVVHSHGRGTAKFVGLCRAARLIRSRHVFHDHFGSIDVDRRVDRGLKLATHLGVDRYVGVSEALCRWAVGCLGVPHARVTLVANGVDARRFEPAPRAPAGTVTVVMVGGLREVKDHTTALRALGGSEHRQNVELLVVGPTYGDGYERACLGLVDDLGLGSHVRLLGPCTDIPAVLAASDIGVLASRSESGPLALLEYMAAGLPYVVTNTGELARRVRSSGAGFVVPPGDVDAWRAALDRLIAMDPAERTAMGLIGRALVLERFDQRLAAGEVASVYRSLPPGRGPVSRR